MEISGYSIPVLDTYRPIVQPALEWVQTADGYWKASDRGTAADVYEAEVEFSARETPLFDLLTTLQSSRGAFTLTCSAGEEIFGPEVGLVNIATVQEFGVLRRAGWKRYSYQLRLRAISPTLSGTPSLSGLRLRYFYDSDRSWDLMRKWSLGGSLTTIDGGADVGLLVADFHQTTAETIAIRRYLLGTARGASVSMPSIAGLTYPFGPRAGVGPFNCRILSHELTRASLGRWNIRITFAEDG